MPNPQQLLILQESPKNDLIQKPIYFMEYDSISLVLEKNGTNFAS